MKPTLSTCPVAEFEPADGLFVLTPEVATLWLEHRWQGNYRKLDQRHIARLVRDIASGAYEVTNESLGFSWDGLLIDGQHRLHAIVEAGKAVLMRIVTNLDPDCVKNIDGGKSRNTTDLLRARGVKYASLSGSVARNLMLRELGVRSTRISPAQIWNWIDGNNELLRACGHGTSLYNQSDLQIIRPLTLAMLSYLAIPKLHSESHLDAFIVPIVTGSGLTKGSPQHVLRRRQLIRMQGLGTGVRKENGVAELHAVLHTLGAWMTSSPLKLIRVDGYDLLRLPVIDYMPKYRSSNSKKEPDKASA